MNKIGPQTPKMPRPTSAPPEYTSRAQLDNSEEMKQSNVWYVLSILSSIFCCLPCGVIGVVHAMVAQHDAELSRTGPQRTRIRKAKCCTCVSFGLGLLGFAIVIVVVWIRVELRWCNYFGYSGVDDVIEDTIYDDDVNTLGPIIEYVYDPMEETTLPFFDDWVPDVWIPSSWLNSDEGTEYQGPGRKRPGHHGGEHTREGDGGSWKESDEEHDGRRSGRRGGSNEVGHGGSGRVDEENYGGGHGRRWIYRK